MQAVLGCKAYFEKFFLMRLRRRQTPTNSNAST
jgi:hypothetical protein